MIHPAQGVLKINHRTRVIKSMCQIKRGTIENNPKINYWTTPIHNSGCFHQSK